MNDDAIISAEKLYEKMCEDARQANYRVEPVIEYESKLPGITPQMAFWWWDNMGPIERYRIWSPDHLEFKWEIDTSQGRIGAIHSVTEYVAGIPVFLRLRYEDPKDYPGILKCQHAIVESSLTSDDRIMGWVLHEFDETAEGLVMRNVFHLTVGTPKEIVEAIVEHSTIEMETLPKFLPGLFAENVS